MPPSNGSPDAWASRWRTVAPGGPAGSSRSSDALLGGDERTRERGDGLRHGREQDRRRRVAARRDAPRRRSSRRRRRTARPMRRSGAVRPRGAILGARVERRLITGHSPYEARRGLLARGRRRRPGPRRRHGADPAGRLAAAGERLRAGALCLAHHRRGARPRRVGARARRAHAASTSPIRPHWGEVARAHGEVFGETSARRDLRRARSCSTPPGRSRSRPRRCSRESSSSRPSITGLAGRARGERRSTTASARATRTRSASRRSTCSSTRDSFDLVQHIETVLDAVAGRRARRPASTAELMQSVLEIATPVCANRRAT